MCNVLKQKSQTKFMETDRITIKIIKYLESPEVQAY